MPPVQDLRAEFSGKSAQLFANNLKGGPLITSETEELMSSKSLDSRNPLLVELKSNEARAIIAAATSEMKSAASLADPVGHPHAGVLTSKFHLSEARRSLGIPELGKSAPSPSQAIIAAATREMETTSALSDDRSSRAHKHDATLGATAARQFLLAAVEAPPVHRPFSSTRDFSVSQQRKDMDSFFDSLDAHTKAQQTSLHAEAIRVSATRRLMKKAAAVHTAAPALAAHRASAAHSTSAHPAPVARAVSTAHPLSAATKPVATQSRIVAPSPEAGHPVPARSNPATVAAAPNVQAGAIIPEAAEKLQVQTGKSLSWLR